MGPSFDDSSSSLSNALGNNRAGIHRRYEWNESIVSELTNPSMFVAETQSEKSEGNEIVIAEEIKFNEHEYEPLENMDVSHRFQTSNGTATATGVLRHCNWSAQPTDMECWGIISGALRRQIWSAEALQRKCSVARYGVLRHCIYFVNRDHRDTWGSRKFATAAVDFITLEYLWQSVLLLLVDLITLDASEDIWHLKVILYGFLPAQPVHATERRRIANW